VSEVRVVPVDTVPWTDVEQVFGTRGDPSTCWCQFFKMSGPEFAQASRELCRPLLEQQVRTLDPPPGVIAYLDDEPVGWCAVEPRPHYQRVIGSVHVERAGALPLDDESIWAVTCFVVRVGFRRRGVGGALLAGAVDQARAHGAASIEGYPMDTEGEKKSSADLYHGTVTLFTNAGFEVIARTAPHRALVRLEL
jgi:GNAT superfamily N-acetyltransferase